MNKDDLIPFKEPFIDTGFSGGASFKKTFNSKPWTIVRYSPDDQWDLDRAIVARGEFNALRNKFGIYLPHIDFVNGDEFYTVTERVEGIDLRSALVESNPVVLDKYQSLVTGLLNYLKSRSRLTQPLLGDIYSMDQYMYGHTKQNPLDEIYLVDVDLRLHHSRKIGEFRKNIWLRRVCNLATDVIEAEQIVGEKLERARNSITDFVNGLPTDKIYDRGAQAILDVLTIGEEISGDDWDRRLYPHDFTS
jgi:hypothetical protein